jgi:catechol 2,3-dioxygenase-like lactoylglutathione lyase family enzyme
MTEASATAQTAAAPDRAGTWPRGIAAITLFVEDLAATRRFYQEVFGLPVAFEDDASTVFRFDNTMINLLKADEAPELIHPAAVAPLQPEPGCSSPSKWMTSTPCAPSWQTAESNC